MGTIKEIFSKEPYEVGISDINKLIEEKREESHTLEYKSPKILRNPDELSKWVSALLNSDGGLIIIGVTEDDPGKKERIKAKIYPENIEYVSAEFNKERIDQIVSNNIYSSSRPDIRIYPVRNSEVESGTLYLIEVPQGDNPPYQAADGRYYRRLNATKYIMRHSEVADFFGKRRKPRLDLIFNLTKVAGGISNTFDLQISVTNTGSAIAKNARIIVSFEHLQILKIKKGPDHRIDELRNNVATLQWDSLNAVIYPNTKKVLADVIWALQVKPTKRIKYGKGIQLGNIIWEAVAEDMDLIEGKNILVPVPFVLEKGKDYYLPKHEDFWGKNEGDKTNTNIEDD